MYKINTFLITYNLNDKKFIYQKRGSNSGFYQNESIIKELNGLFFNNFCSYIAINFFIFLIIFNFIQIRLLFWLSLIFLIGINFYKINKKLYSHVFLDYRFPEKDFLFNNMNDILSDLSYSNRIYRIKERIKNKNINKFAGNNEIYYRKSVSFKKKYPPHLHSNLKIFTFYIDDFSLSFFPDMLLLLFNNRYISVPYNFLKINYSEKKYNEYKKVPVDAKIIDKTWLHPRKDGKPDKRYKKNREIPVILYAELSFILADFLKLEIQVSDLKAAYNFASIMQGICQKVIIKEYNKKKMKKERYKKKVIDKKTPNLIYFQILGVAPSASSEEIKSAYRKLIKKYHPDLFISKGAGFAKNAEEMMKKINLAYEKVNRP